MSSVTSPACAYAPAALKPEPVCWNSDGVQRDDRAESGIYDLMDMANHGWCL